MKKILMFGVKEDKDYFDCLKQSLFKNNIQIIFLERFPLLELSKILKYRLKEGKIIHYHWINFYYDIDNYMFSIVRSLIFSITTLIFKIIGFKIIWTAHNDLPHETIHKKLEKITRRIFYKLADDIFVRSTPMKNRLIELFGYRKNINVILLGNIPKEKIKWTKIKIPKKQEAREKLKIKDNTKVFVSLGRIWPYRKNDVLIKAFNIYSKKYPNSLLVILGKPKNNEIKNYLITLANKSNKIRLNLYYVYAEEISDYMSAADFVCITNDMYGLTETFSWAMLFNNPSITSDIGSNSEMVNKYGIGLLFKKNDVLSLSKTLEKATKLEKTDLEKISNNIKKVMQKDDWDKIIYNYIEIYKKYI